MICLYLAQVLPQSDESGHARKTKFWTRFPGFNNYIRLGLAYIAFFSWRKIIEKCRDQI
jgi:hypothetical protein